jgi:hypothetical protein
VGSVYLLPTAGMHRGDRIRRRKEQMQSVLTRKHGSGTLLHRWSSWRRRWPGQREEHQGPRGLGEEGIATRPRRCNQGRGSRAQRLGRLPCSWVMALHRIEEGQRFRAAHKGGSTSSRGHRRGAAAGTEGKGGGRRRQLCRNTRRKARDAGSVWQQGPVAGSMARALGTVTVPYPL